MSIFDSIFINIVSLIVILVVPYAMLLHQRKNWYEPSQVRRTQTALMFLAISLAALVLFKLAQDSLEGVSFETRAMTLAHLLALGLIPLFTAAFRAAPSPYAPHAAHDVAAPPPPHAINDQVEKITWDDLVIDESLKSELISVVSLLKDGASAQRYGIETPKGILLEGPPGTGKTSIARAIAHMSGLPMFALRVDQILSSYVGESEKLLTQFFEHAVAHSPSIIFIDEVDAIGGTRESHNSSARSNLLNHLLQLIDGVVASKRIYIVAATNRAERVDPALKRAGRLTKTIRVGLPSSGDREKLLRRGLAKLPLATTVDIPRLVQATAGMSGADITALCNQAGLNAFSRESAEGTRRYQVEGSDLERALRTFQKKEAVS